MSDLKLKIKKWQEAARIKELNKYKEHKCNICNNRGFVIDKRMVEGHAYEYSLHCKCVHANEWKNLMHSFEMYYTESDFTTDMDQVEQEEPCPF